MDIVIHGTVAEMLQHQMTEGNYQSPEDVVYEALEALIKQKANQGIEAGLADIEAGRYVELRPDNLDEITDSIIAKSRQ